jgi:AraC-like DNA-binding protein
MAARPTFGLYTEIPVDNMRAEQREGYECVMCHGTGKVRITNRKAGYLESASSTSLHSRRGLDSVIVPEASHGKISERPGFPRYMIRRIEELVGARLEGRSRIAELAGSLGYSPSHFSRMFRRSFGITPHTYVMRRRVAVAQLLLTRTDLRLAEVALKAGFCDQSHLTRSFRQFAGLPPRAYRALSRTFSDSDATVASTA